jgi:hypothetical protein
MSVPEESRRQTFRKRNRQTRRRTGREPDGDVRPALWAASRISRFAAARGVRAAEGWRNRHLRSGADSVGGPQAQEVCGRETSYEHWLGSAAGARARNRVSRRLMAVRDNVPCSVCGPSRPDHGRGAGSGSVAKRRRRRSERGSGDNSPWRSPGCWRRAARLGRFRMAGRFTPRTAYARSVHSATGYPGAGVPSPVWRFLADVQIVLDPGHGQR